MSLTVTVEELQAATEQFDREAVWGELFTGRYRMRYATWGTGPRTIIVIHGLNDVARSFSMLMAKLIPDFRCVAIELPDGKDGANLGMYRHSDYSHDLLALLDHLKLEQVNLLGSSFGSTIALRTAAMFPNRVRKVVLQGGFARRPLTRAERGLARLGRYWPWKMGQLPIREGVMRRFELAAFQTAPQEVFDFLLSNSAQTPIRAAARRGLILVRLDLRALLPQVRCPVLMIGGDRDTIVPRCFEAEVEAGVANCRRNEYPICGHYAQYTHPSRMAADMQAFLNS
jgi:pimeloyl-ACP methyl ester carboxylesterase